MRILPFIVTTLATVGLIFTLNRQWNLGGNNTPKIGYFLSLLIMVETKRMEKAMGGKALGKDLLG